MSGDDDEKLPLVDNIQMITEWPVHSTVDRISKEHNINSLVDTCKTSSKQKTDHTITNKYMTDHTMTSDENTTENTNRCTSDHHTITSKHIDEHQAACQHMMTSTNRKRKHALDIASSSRLNKTESLARVSLARWWRRTSHTDKDKLVSMLPKRCNANTLLSAIARTDIGNKFIVSEVKRLEDLVAIGNFKADVTASLGSFYEMLGKFEEADKWLNVAIQRGPQEKEYKWLLAKIKKQLVIHKIQSMRMQDLQHDVLKTTTEVERISAEKLTFQEFFYKFAMTSTPVVITDLVEKMTRTRWSLDYIKSIAGNCSVRLRRLVSDSFEWAKLEEAESMKLCDYIDKLQEGKEEHLYLFDWSLPHNCPCLAEQLIIPKYFAGDFLQRTTPGSLYKDSWPSLFIAPPGVRSETHVDAFGSNFWMALFEGKKRWLFFPKEDVPFLYPKYGHSMDPVFEVNLSDPDLTKHPLFQLTNPIECVLQPGELLFVPAGCPHRVENLELSVAISANYVDLSNMDMVKNELKINALVDPQSLSLLQQLECQSFNSDLNMDTDHLSWSNFKLKTLSEAAIHK